MHHLQNCLNVDTPVTNVKKNPHRVLRKYQFSKCFTPLPSFQQMSNFSMYCHIFHPEWGRLTCPERSGFGGSWRRSEHSSESRNLNLVWDPTTNFKKIGVIRILKEVWAKALWLVGSFIPQQKNNPLKSGELCNSCRNWRLRSLGILFHFQKVKLK